MFLIENINNLANGRQMRNVCGKKSWKKTEKEIQILNTEIFYELKKYKNISFYGGFFF